MGSSLYHQDTIERQRRGRDAGDASIRSRTGGYLVWQFNESWPHIFSAKVDYFLEPLYSYYAIRRAFSPLLMSFDIGTVIRIWGVNDTRLPVKGTVRVSILHLDRNEYRKELVREITIPAGQSISMLQVDEAGIGIFRREHVLSATLTDASGVVMARAHAIMDIERRTSFPAARLSMRVDGGVLELTTDRFARAVPLEGSEEGNTAGWFFEDNYFDLMPGEVKRVRVLGRHAKGRVTARPWYSPHETEIDFSR